MEPDQLIIILKLTLAALLGGLLGLERGHTGKAAGMRTYSLTALGATLFTVVAKEAYHFFANVASGFDPLRVIAQIIIGVGFVAAGIIIQRRDHVRGLTTAAGLWVSAGIGIAVGIGLYWIAAFATVLVLFVLMALFRIEKFLERRVGFEVTPEYEHKEKTKSS